MTGEKEIRENEKLFQEMKSIVEALDGHLQNLQSNAFQLANFYFVFQGVILVAIFRSGSPFPTCSDRWFLFTLSLLAASVNLFALFTIGLKYLRTLNQQYEAQTECDELKQRSFLGRQSPSPDSQRHPERSVVSYKDPWREIKHASYFIVCMLLFLGFAGVTLYGCLKILCRKDECEEPPQNEGCINICDSDKCLRLCSTN